MPALRALRVLLWFIAAYQFLVGALLLLTPGFAQLVVAWYGAHVEWTDQFAFILKPLGAYMLMTGMIAAGTARARVPHPSITSALAVLFAINALYRIVNFQHIQSTFQIASWHLLGQIATLSALGLACVLLTRAAMRETGAVAGDGPVGGRA